MTAIIKNSIAYRLVKVLHTSYLNSSLLKLSKTYEQSCTKSFVLWLKKVSRSSLLYALLHSFLDISENLSDKSFIYKLFTYPFMMIIKLLQAWPGRLVSRSIDNSSFYKVLADNKKHFMANAVFYSGLGMFAMAGVLTFAHFIFNRTLDRHLYIYAVVSVMGLLVMCATTAGVNNKIKNSCIYRISSGLFQGFWRE